MTSSAGPSVSKHRALAILLLTTTAAFSGHADAQRATDPQQRFKQLDANSDGRVTREESGNAAWFDRIDRNGDGVITRDDLPRPREGKATPASTPTKADIPYGDHEAQRLDLYASDDTENAPIMLYVHGGGWRKGDKNAVGQKADFFTGKDWLFISTNYRLLPDGKHPNNVADIAAAIAWVSKHAKEHGGDPDKIFLMGHSAGCHLVSLVATDERQLAKHDLPLSVIKGVVANDTQAYDIAKLVEEIPASLYPQVFGTDPEMQCDASPMHHIAADKGIPPFLILYSRGMTGAVASPRRAACANSFADALNAAGAKAKVIDGSDRNHGQINQRLGDPEDNITQAMTAFLEGILEGAKRFAPAD